MCWKSNFWHRRAHCVLQISEGPWLQSVPGGQWHWKAVPMKKITGIRRFRFEKWACLSCCNNSNHAFPSGELISDDSPWNSSRSFSPDVLWSYSWACTIHSNLPISRISRDSAVLPSSYSSQAVLIFVPRLGLIGYNKFWMYRVPKSSSLNLCSIIFQGCVGSSEVGILTFSNTSICRIISGNWFCHVVAQGEKYTPASIQTILLHQKNVTVIESIERTGVNIAKNDNWYRWAATLSGFLIVLNLSVRGKCLRVSIKCRKGSGDFSNSEWNNSTMSEKVENVRWKSLSHWRMLDSCTRKASH